MEDTGILQERPHERHIVPTEFAFPNDCCKWLKERNRIFTPHSYLPQGILSESGPLKIRVDGTAVLKGSRGKYDVMPQQRGREFHQIRATT
jgi:hypothetical protein